MHPTKRIKGPRLSNASPENTIIAFDIHGVIFKTDYKKIFKLLWHNKKAAKLLLFIWHPKVIKTLFRLRKKESVVEEYVMALAKVSKHFREFIPLGIEIANAQKPVPETIKLIKTLKSLGYRLDIISNIGQIIYYDLVEKYPAIFAHFKNAHVACAEFDYVAKPHPIVYKSYQEKHNPDKHQIVFIDDKKKNLKSAARFGMTGIYVSNTDHIRDDILALGLL